MIKLVISTILITCIFIGLTACEAKDNPDIDTTLVDGYNETQALTEANKPEGDSYSAVPIQIPHDRIFNECIWQNYLFYLADEHGETVVVRIDLDNPTDLVVMSLGYSTWMTYQYLAVDDNGMIHVFAITHEQGDGNWDLVDIFWHHVDDTGMIIKSITITERFITGFTPIDFCIDVAGNAYVIALGFGNQFVDMYGGKEALIVMDKEGEAVFQTVLPMLGYFFKDGAGIVNIAHMYSNVITQINPAIWSLENNLDISELPDNRDIIGLGIGMDGTLFYATKTGAYDYNNEKGELIERLKWASVGVFVIGGSGYESQIYPLANGQYLWVKRSDGDWGFAKAASYRIIRLQTAEDIAAAEALAKEWEEIKTSGRVGDITIATVGYVNRELIKAIQDFNSAHPYSRIELRRYGAETGDDHSEGLEQLNMDIISGRNPDMLLLPQDLSYGAYATMGLFRDLYPFLEADENFIMADYRENIIRAYEIDGKLYGIPIDFGVELLYARADELEGLVGWNMDEFVAFAGRFPSSSIFQHPTKTEVLDICLMANGGNLVDWASRDVGFDRDLVRKILEFAGHFADDDEFLRWPGMYAEYMERISNGDIHLMRGRVSASLQMYEELFRGPVTPIGYPSERGNGYMIHSNSVVTISSKCTYIDTAWQFISFLLSDEIQSREGIHYPVRRDNIESYLAYAREMSFYSGLGPGFGFDARPATEAEIRAFLVLLDTASEIRLFDQQIDNIIKEEAGSYFSGNKPLDSVVDVISNRVGIYVMEIK